MSLESVHSDQIMPENGDILDRIVDALPSGLLLFEDNGHILRMNDKARDILCLSPDACLLSIREGLPGYLAPLADLLYTQNDEIRRGELTLSLPNRAEESIVGYNLKHFLLSDGRMLKLFIFSDITQIQKERLTLDKIKDELSQSKKLASLGTLVAGVAHELNNPLTGISMSASLIQRNLERLQQQTAIDPSRLSDSLGKALQEVGKIVSASEKAGVLVGDLLAYAKPAQLVFTPIPFHALLQDMVGALKSHPQFAQFAILIEGETARWIACDRVKLEQVFYNLLKNACEATDGRGSVRIFYSEQTDESGRLFVRAHVKDDGPGIDKTIINRIFDPFFTTKGHSGVGLGLSISYRTVEQHGGLLSVDSVKGEGAEHVVSLPVCEPPEDAASTASGGAR